MTATQQKQFNMMRETLRRISKEYQTPERLARICQKEYGLDVSEALEMAYENIQQEAAQAIKGVKTIK